LAVEPRVDGNVRDAVSINADPADYKLGGLRSDFLLISDHQRQSCVCYFDQFFTAVGVKVEEKLDYLAAR
jgi:hypothetical protein